MTDSVRSRATPAGLELYYPPFRTPEVALPLALFGAIAFLLPAAGAAALLPVALATPAGTLAAVLVGTFVVPVALFGLVLLAQAVFMLANALHVFVDRTRIETARSVLGLVVRRRRMSRSEVAAIEPFIASRQQTLFGREPLFQLIACDAARRTRLVVGESLRGNVLAERIRVQIENALGLERAEVPTERGPTQP